MSQKLQDILAAMASGNGTADAGVAADPQPLGAGSGSGILAPRGLALPKITAQVSEGDMSSSGVEQEISIPDGYSVNTQSGGWVADGGNFTLLHPSAPGFLTYTPATATEPAKLTFTLTDSIDHPLGQGANTDIVSFPQVTFQDGQGQESAMDVKIQVVDDVPTISRVSPTPEEIRVNDVVKGAFDIDHGADGPADDNAVTLTVCRPGYPAFEQEVVPGGGPVKVVIDGVEYGTFTLNADGTYEYVHGREVPGASRPAYDAEHVALLEFKLTVTDGDGDSASSSFRHGFYNREASAEVSHVGAGVSVNEANLDGGSDPNPAALTQTIALHDRYTVEIDSSWTQDGSVYFIESAYGKLVYDPSNPRQLTYTLNGHFDHSSDGVAADVFKDIQFYNSRGAMVKADVVIDIKDDSPEVQLTSPDGKIDSGTDFVGTWDHEFGIDGAAAAGAYKAIITDDYGLVHTFDLTMGGSTPIIIDGITYGSLVLEDGKFTFKAAPNTEANLSIIFQITDGDGSTATSNEFNLEINYNKVNLVLGEDLTFFEKNLDGGTDENAAALTQVVNFPSEYTLDTTGWTAGPNGTVVKSGAYGDLTWDGNQLTYTLKAPVSNAANEDIANDVISGILFKDKAGNDVTAEVRPSIQDDAPEVSFGGAGQEATSGFDFEGTWDINYGADGGNAMGLKVTDGSNTLDIPALALDTPTDLIIGGVNYGTITIHSDNTYTFTPAPNTTGNLTFSLTGEDSDGDLRSSQPFDVTVKAPNPLGNISLEGNANLDESNLDKGTAPNQAALVKYFDLPADCTVDVTGWTSGSGDQYTKVVDYGTLTYDSVNRTLSYQLTSSATHGAQGKDSLPVVIPGLKLIDAGGNTHVVNGEFAIVDDVPVAVNVTGDQHVTKDDQSFDGFIKLVEGADQGGNETDTHITFQLQCQYGSQNGSESITLPKDGSTVSFDTFAGRMTLSYEAGQVKYSYDAGVWLKGAVEKFTFTMTDGDGDQSSADLNINFDVPFDISMTVDEAGIPGLGSMGWWGSDNTDDLTLPPALIMDGATNLVWNVPNPGLYKADGNGDGNYSTITWKQNGNNLEGYAEGELVVSVEAGFKNGQFTGELNTTLYKPLQHDGINVPDDTKAIELELTQQAVGKEDTKLNINLNVVDDAPFRNPGFSTGIDIVKGSVQPQDVYLLMDVSGSISRREGEWAVEAVKALAKSYIDNGIDAVFTISTFNKYADTYFVQVTAQEVINNLNWKLIRHCGGSTNYEVGLKETMSLMEAANNSPYSSWHQQMYFISDGKQNAGEKYLTNWSAYRDSRGDDLDVVALCVEKCKVSAKAYQNMLKVCGDPEDYYHVKDYSALLNQMVELVTTESSGDMYSFFASADKTILTDIEYAGKLYHIGENGTTINLGDGIKMTVYQDGKYTIQSTKNTSDITKDITLHVRDADGDTHKGETSLVIRYEEQAYDNVSIASPYAESSYMYNFHDLRPGTSNGTYSFHKLPCGLTLPSIEGHSSGNYGAELKQSTYGPNALQKICGGANGVQQVFQEMGLKAQSYENNTIVSMNVTQSGGEVAFNWAFKPGNHKTSEDSAFWVLTDAKGNVVDCGLLFQGRDGKWHTGITTVQLPDIYQTYSLHVVQQEMGGASSCYKSQMWLKDVVYYPDGVLRSSGNVLWDESPDGHKDSFGMNERLYSVWYNDVEYVFNGSAVVIDADQGRMTINADGSYTFMAHKGVDTDLVEDFTYTVKNSHGDELQADLHIRSDDRVMQGNDGNNLLDNTANSRDGDLIMGGAGNDTIIGGAGDEVIYGGVGNDSINAGDGNDLVHGGDGNDTIHGGNGDDTIYGGAGDDVLFGGEGNDVLYGGTGNDFLNGGAGDDILYGGSGSNVLVGGDGADTFAWDNSSRGGLDIISDFLSTEGDKLNFKDLLDPGESMNSFLQTDITHLNIDTDARTLSFIISGNSKAVEIHFQDNDTNFDTTAASYNAAQTSGEEMALLHNFLISLTV